MRREFANGELFIRPNESVRGSDAFVIQSYTAPINQWLMESLILVDALKRASAKRITVVAPFYPYARQDKKHRGREPISARLVADLFKTAGADRLMAVDLHTAQIQGFFDGPVDHLFALPLLSRHVLHNYGDKDLVVVSPDTGRVRTAEQWADALGGLDIAFVHKTRDIDAANEIVANRVVGDVAGRCCLLIDDMIDTAGSITKAADLLFDTGATDVVVAATHGVFSAPAVDRLKNSPDQRGRRDEHAADPSRAGVRQAHRPLDRPPAGSGDQGGLRGRLGHQPLRRPLVTGDSVSQHAAIAANWADVEGLAAGGRVDAGGAAARARPRRASRPSRPAPRGASCGAGRTPRRSRRTPRPRDADVAGGSRRTRRTSAESTFGTGQNTARDTAPARWADAYQAAFTDGTP